MSSKSSQNLSKVQYQMASSEHFKTPQQRYMDALNAVVLHQEERFKRSVQEAGVDFDVTMNDNMLLRLAASNKSLAILRWLVEDSCQPVDVTARDHEAIRMAEKNKDPEVHAYLEAVEQLGLTNFRLAMCVFDKDLEAVRVVASLASAGLTLTADDIQSLFQSACSARPVSTRRL